MAARASPIPVFPEVPSMIVPPGFNFPLLLGYFNHLQSHAVFRGIARVEVFNFGKNGARQVFRDLI
jgi:hypothetical protein